MGLDGIELVMELEEAFQLWIPDEDAEQLITPGAVVEYLYGRVGAEQSPVCVEQRVFYRLRRASMSAFGLPRSSIKPATRWEAVLPETDRRHFWKVLHRATGSPHWPRLTLFGKIPEKVATVRGTADYLAKNGAGAFLHPGEGWSRRDVEATVKRAVCEQLGIKEFRWEDEFVRDLGLN